MNDKTNIGNIFLKLVKKRLNPEIALEYGCNCRSSNECRLQNKRFIPKFFYRADVENDINNARILWGV